MNTPSIKILAAVVSTVFLAIDSKAALLAYEGFSDYGVPSNLQGANGGSGWGGSWNVGRPGEGFMNEVRDGAPLNYSGYNGGTTPAASGGNYFNLASGFGFDTYNFGIRTLDVAGAFSAYNVGGNIGADNTTLWGSMLYASTDTNGHLRLRDSADVDRIDISLLSGANSLIVFRINFGSTANSDSISIWNNPTLAFDSGSTPSSTVSNIDLSFSKVFIFRDTAEGENKFDDIRFGNLSSDVIPVPEPSTVAFLAFSGLAILAYPARARRRNA